MTTEHEFRWKDATKIDLSGVCIVAMLLRSGRAVTYERPELLRQFFDELGYPQTGFIKAMSDSSVDLSKATLKSTAIPTKPATKRPLNHQENVKTSPSYKSQKKRKELLIQGGK